MKINLILLASGNSTRYGSNKLINTKQGKPMVSLVLDTILNSQGFLLRNSSEEFYWNQIIVVTQYEEVATIANNLNQKNIVVVKNSNPNKGISHSISLGIRKGDLDVDAYCFSVSDQPFLTTSTFKKLVQVYENKKGIVAVKSHNQKGSPVVFNKKFKQDLLTLQGDVGGKNIIKRYPQETTWVNIENKQELIDIDTLEDWERS